MSAITTEFTLPAGFPTDLWKCQGALEMTIMCTQQCSATEAAAVWKLWSGNNFPKFYSYRNNRSHYSVTSKILALRYTFTQLKLTNKYTTVHRLLSLRIASPQFESNQAVSYGLICRGIYSFLPILKFWVEIRQKFLKIH